LLGWASAADGGLPEVCAASERRRVPDRVKLMRSAFNPDSGSLADSSLDPGERVGVMELFAGSIGTFKNPPSHRQVNYGDPTEASEVVLLADLLMRLLDRVAARIGEG